MTISIVRCTRIAGNADRVSRAGIVRDQEQPETEDSETKKKWEDMKPKYARRKAHEKHAAATSTHKRTCRVKHRAIPKQWHGFACLQHHLCRHVTIAEDVIRSNTHS